MVLAAYLLVLLGVAALARRARADGSPADHFLGGRELGVSILFLTLYATAYSGNSLLGYPGEAYRRGFSWIMATGFMMSIMVVFHLLAPRLRPVALRHGFVTPGDWIRHRFAGQPGVDLLRQLVALLMSVALANFLLAQLVAMGHVAHALTGGLLPYAGGVVGLAALILFYETWGGLRAVAWTDAVQGILMMLGLATLLGWLLGEGGGLPATTRAIVALRPDALALPGAREQLNWASTLVLLGLASVVYPQAIQRIFAARSGRSLSRAFALMTFMPLTTTLVVTLIGWAAIPRLVGLGALQADTVMPRLLQAWAAEGSVAAWGAALVFVGALSAIMSTADSVLLSLGSVIAADLLGRSRNDPDTTRLGKRAAALVLVGAVLLALTPRLTLWRLIELKMELLIQCSPAFLLALHWSRLDARCTLAGALTGTLLAGGLALLGVPRLAGIHVGVVGLAGNLAVAILGTRWGATRRRL